VSTTQANPAPAAPEASPPPEGIPGIGRHVPVLDGLRGVAILLVLVFHYTQHYTHDKPIGQMILEICGAGWFGVDLFFVLSGFLITGILFDSRSGPGYFKNFYMRRFLRIFPLYYLAIAGVIAIGLLVPGFDTPGFRKVFADQAWLWLYGVNVAELVNTGYDFGSEWFDANHFWSLAVEEHFYLLWPLLLWKLNRTWAMRLCLGVFALSAVSRVGALAIGLDPYKVYVFTLFRLDGLAAGGYLALAMRGPVSLPQVRRVAGVFGAVCVAGVLGVFAVAQGTDEFHPAVQTAGFTMLAMAFASLIAWSVATPRRNPLVRLMESPVLRLFGKYSYGIYVYHFLFKYLMQDWFNPVRLGQLGGGFLVGLAMHVVLSSLFCLAVAFVSYHAFERQFLRLKKLFEYRRPASGGVRA
jgi:peptidoglycan/LPS O-acetylase OafA/YrhL